MEHWMGTLSSNSVGRHRGTKQQVPMGLFLRWYSITKIMELSAIASAIALAISGLYAIDFFSQESVLDLAFRGPVHGVVRTRVIDFFESKHLPVPEEINLASTLPTEPDLADTAFLNFIPDPKSKGYTLADFPMEGKALTPFLRWSRVIDQRNNYIQGFFSISQDFKYKLSALKVKNSNILLEGLVKSTVTAMAVSIINSGDAEATDVVLRVIPPYSPSFTIYSPYDAGGVLLKVRALGQVSQLQGQNSFEISIPSIKPSAAETIIVYTVGDAIERRDFTISKSDKPKLNKLQAFLVVGLSEVICISLVVFLDIRKVQKGYR